MTALQAMANDNIRRYGLLLANGADEVAAAT
jgi:hypothetical protein